MSGDGSESPFEDVSWGEDGDEGEDNQSTSVETVMRDVLGGVIIIILLVLILYSGAILQQSHGIVTTDETTESDVEPLVSVAAVNEDTIEVSWRPTTGSWEISTTGYSFRGLSEGQYRVYGWFDAETDYISFEEHVVVAETTPTVSNPTATPPPTGTATPTPTEGGGPGFGPLVALLALSAFALWRVER
jgi:hypothetical protein